MFPHLMGMKEVHHLSSEDMGAIIGTSRQTYEYKAKCGSFTPFECKALCRWFHKSFDYLFATLDEIDKIDAAMENRRGFAGAESAGMNAEGADGAKERQEVC